MLKYFSNYLQVYLSTSIYVFIRNMKISLNIVSRDSMIFDWNVEFVQYISWNLEDLLGIFLRIWSNFVDTHQNIWSITKNQIGMCEWGTRHNVASNYSKILSMIKIRSTLSEAPADQHVEGNPRLSIYRNLLAADDGAANLVVLSISLFLCGFRLCASFLKKSWCCWNMPRSMVVRNSGTRDCQKYHTGILPRLSTLFAKIWKNLEEEEEIYPFVPKTRGRKENSERSWAYFLFFCSSRALTEACIGAISFLLGRTNSEQSEMSNT